jgi:serine/threonine protein phosphatase PrpC
MIMTEIIWKTIGSTVRGASHFRSGLPNQDAIKFVPDSGEGTHTILAVSDGHGSASYFRSDHGARLAVDAACEVCSRFLKDYAGRESVQDIKFKDVICREIVRCWLEKVNLDILQNPFTSKEEEIIKNKMGDPQKRAETRRPRPSSSDGPSEYQILPYGATILAAIVTQKYFLFLQLGDGDILTVSPEGVVSRPLPGDERLIANETTSLCLPVAWDEFRIRYQPVDTHPPALILISSDGYANSYPDNKNFEKVGTDLLAMILEEKEGIEKGIDSISEKLESWMKETTEKGCGDDISLGIVCNLEVLRAAARLIHPPNETKAEVIQSTGPDAGEPPAPSASSNPATEVNRKDGN